MCLERRRARVHRSGSSECAVIGTPSRSVSLAADACQYNPSRFIRNPFHASAHARCGRDCGLRLAAMNSRTLIGASPVERAMSRPDTPRKGPSCREADKWDALTCGKRTGPQRSAARVIHRPFSKMARNRGRVSWRRHERVDRRDSADEKRDGCRRHVHSAEERTAQAAEDSTRKGAARCVARASPSD